MGTCGCNLTVLNNICTLMRAIIGEDGVISNPTRSFVVKNGFGMLDISSCSIFKSTFFAYSNKQALSLFARLSTLPHHKKIQIKHGHCQSSGREQKRQNHIFFVVFCFLRLYGVCI
jgi:hypothetical protein